MDMSAKPTGTQPGHAVTDHSNHTSVIKKAQVDKAEQEFQKMIDSGKVSDINKARAAVAKKFGVWPNGATN